MILKRQYDHSGKTPIVSGVKIMRAKQRQNFSPGFVNGGLTEGWLSMADGKILIGKGKDTVTYVIAHPPGMYCCHCDQALTDSNDARAHLSAEHPGAVSPDPNNPAGYRQDNFFACILQGKEVNNLSRDEAIAMNKKIRDALHRKIGKKYGSQEK